MDRPTHQRRQAHNRRKTLARTRHHLREARRIWANAWRKWQRKRGPKPERIKLPRAVRKHKPALHREFMAHFR